MNTEAYERPASLRVLLAPFGTEGDIRPFLWLADRLAKAGHKVSFVTNPIHAGLVAGAGYPCRCVGDEAATRRLFEDRRLWEGMKGSRLVLRALMQDLRPMTLAFLDPALEVDIILGSSLALCAAIGSEVRRIPFARVHLQPMVFRSTTAMPLLSPSLAWLRRMPAFAIRGFFGLIDLSLDGAPLREINKFRSELGLGRWRSFYKDAFCGQGPCCGLFPEWFGEPQPDWPVKVQCFDFPLHRCGSGRPLPDVLRGFLDAGDAPVLWTHGSGNRHTEDYARAAEHCCREIGRRGILVAPAAETASHGHSQGDFLRLAYAPFEGLLPRCCAIVHHGGIGTMAEALKAGCPQLIIPRAHDQFDNAARAVRLEYAMRLDYRRLDEAADTLRTLIEAGSHAVRAKEIGSRIQGGDGIVAWVEQFAARHVASAPASP